MSDLLQDGLLKYFHDTLKTKKILDGIKETFKFEAEDKKITYLGDADFAESGSTGECTPFKGERR